MDDKLIEIMKEYGYEIEIQEGSYCYKGILLGETYWYEFSLDISGVADVLNINTYTLYEELECLAA